HRRIEGRQQKFFIENDHYDEYNGCNDQCQCSVFTFYCQYIAEQHFSQINRRLCLCHQQYTQSEECRKDDADGRIIFNITVLVYKPDAKSSKQPEQSRSV